MKRRTFIQTIAAAALTANGASAVQRQTQKAHVPDILTYLNRQITPAAAAQSAAQSVAQKNGQKNGQSKTGQNKTGKLGEGDIFWSVMWPYMYTVGKAEGTVGNSLGLNPYQIIYTYDTFENFDDHPRRAYPILDADGRPTGKVSDAAGWPQFISTTWDTTRQKHPFWYDGPSFQAANQDLGFLYLHQDTGAHGVLMAGVTIDPPTQRLTVSYEKFMQAISLDSQQWASLPGANIGEATGQHTRPKWWLWSQFQWALWKQMGYRRSIVHPIGTDKRVTSKMGYQAWRGATHWGQDFACQKGTEIRAPEDGRVTLTGYEPKGGYYLSFRPFAQPELDVIFRHCLHKSAVALNTPVKAGILMGHAGNSGQSTTAPHAHIEVTVDGQHIDPHYYLGMSQWF
ncbi:MAG: M23 family metallopeptidase [Cyanobacteria bacterium J06559_1]